MGLTLNLYRSNYYSPYDALNGFDTVVVTNVNGPVNPSDLAPAVTLEVRAGSCIIRPDFSWMVAEGLISEEQARGNVMASGVLAATSDSRFADELRRLGFDSYVGLHVHSYVEPWQVSRSFD